MEKIAIFYHIYQVNHWEKLFEQQIISLQQSGVYDAASYIHFGINGDLPLPYNLIKVNSTKRNLKTDSEADTLESIHSFSLYNPDFKILYVHTKGISYPQDHEGQTSWLRYLDYFNIKRWRECAQLLDHYDCVGTDWTVEHPDQTIKVPPHYSGNFWWANSNYITKLDRSYLYRVSSESEEAAKIQIEERHSPEFWIGTGNPKHFNYYSTNKNKYVQIVQPEEYENLPIDIPVLQPRPQNLSFEYRVIYSKFWQMLANGLNEAYGHTEEPGTHVSLGTYTLIPAEEIKNQPHIKKLIVYQAEPLVENHWWNPDYLIDKVKGADEIWDYDLENVRILRDKGFNNVKFKPPIYAKSLKKVKNVANPDIDVLFYGVLTPYRGKMMYDLVEGISIPDELAERYLNVNTVSLWNVHSDQLDEFIGRSKIILNLKPYDGECRQQQTRIFYTLINNKCVLSEKSRINYYGDMIVEFSGVQDMFYKIMHLLENDNWRKYTANNFEDYSKKIFENGEDFFAPLLETKEQ